MSVARTTVGARNDVVSSFTLVKGMLIEETYTVFAAWDLTATRRANLDRVRDDNRIGAQSATWLRDVAKVINRRFDPDGRDRALVILAQQGCPLDVWRPILLWHITRDEFLLRDFLESWLFPAFEAGTFRITVDDVLPFLATIADRGGKLEHVWTPTTSRRVASALLKAATDFGLLRGTIRREFTGYHLPEPALLYLLHALSAETPNAQRIIASPVWRLYLTRPADIEHELLRLHQFRRLHYEAAGTLGQLTLPAANALAFAERLGAAA